MTAPFLDPYVRAQFQAQGIATMGLDADWDRAVTNLLTWEVKAHVQEEFGADALAGNEDDADQRDAERQYGPNWREHPAGKEVWQRCVTNGAARDKAIEQHFYVPLWEAQRQVALTPAPSLAAAIWKATLIEVAALWNDLPMSERGADCVAIIDADLARLSPVEGERA